MTLTTDEHLIRIMNLFNAVCPAYFGQIEITENVETSISTDPMYHIIHIVDENRYKIYKSTNDNKVIAYIEGLGYALSRANFEMKRTAKAKSYFGLNESDKIVLDIINRKIQGHDCSEEESGIIKQWVKNTIIQLGTGQAQLISDIQIQFPQEYGEAIDEQNDGQTIEVYPEINISIVDNGHQLYVDLGDGRRLFATTDNVKLIERYYSAEEPDCVEAKHELINYVMDMNGITDYDLCF